MNMIETGAALGVLMLACAGIANATENVHRAHEHGVGTLNVAVEGGTVELELIAPGADIVGFEHAASSDADRQALAAAVTTLRGGSGLFVFPDGADCSLADASVESGLMDTAKHAERDEHGNGQEHTEGEERAEGEEHSEFHARYRFDCAEPDSLDAIEVRYFDLFPMARELDANILTETGQTAVELTRDAAQLEL